MDQPREIDMTMGGRFFIVKLKETHRQVLFNDTFNTFTDRLRVSSINLIKQIRLGKDMFYLTTHDLNSIAGHS